MSHVTRNMLICAKASGRGKHAAPAKRARVRSAGLLSLALFTSTIAVPTAGRAETIQIPAITFVHRTLAEGDAVGDANFGTLTNATGVFFAPVPFPTDGAVVCGFTFVHRDGDSDPGNDITARLLKKKIVIGGLPFAEPVQMAKVQTTAGVATVQKRKDRTIKQPIIDLGHAFYYVELTVPFTLLEVLGVQIDVRSTCD